MNYDEFFKYYEAKNNNVPDTKDFERIANILKFDSDISTSKQKMAKLIKDKSKATRRGIANYILEEGSLEELRIFIEKYWNSIELKFYDPFFYRAKELGATQEEIISACEIALRKGTYKKYLNDIHQYEDAMHKEKYVNEKGEDAERHSNGIWLNNLNKNLSKSKIPFEYSESKVGIVDRKHKVISNGRKWAEGVILTLWPGEEKELKLKFDILTDEGGGTTLFDIVNSESPENHPFEYSDALKTSGYVNLNMLFKAILRYRDSF